MADDASKVGELVRRAESGDLAAMAEYFERNRARLKQMVHLRMDRRLQGRVDASDVLQDAYVDFSRRLADYAKNPDMPLFLWMRFLVAQRLVDVHRQHLGAAMRDAGQEVALHRGALPQATSLSLAAQLMGRLTTASQAAIRAETQLRVQEALNNMDALDREVLALRHFEMLSNEETAQVLGIKKTAASNRYIRALKRLKKILDGCSGLAP